MSDCDDDSVGYESEDMPIEEPEDDCCMVVEEHTPSPLDIEHPELLDQLRKLGHGGETDGGSGDEMRAMLLTLSVGARNEVQLIGRMATGHSVCVVVHGWSPHLVIQAPAGWQAGMADALQIELECLVRTRLHETPEGDKLTMKLRIKNMIVCIEEFSSQNVMGYVEGRQKSTFLRIRVGSPGVIAPLRDVLHGYMKNESRVAGVHPEIPYAGGFPVMRDGATKTYESRDIDARLQMLVDSNARGGQWFAVPSDHFVDSTHTCDYQMDTDLQSVRWLDMEEHSKVPWLRVASFDIEVSLSRLVCCSGDILISWL